MEKIFRDVAVLGRHGDEFLIVKRNAEFFCETKTDLAASAAEFTADCNDFAHKYLPPLYMYRSDSVSS